MEAIEVAQVNDVFYLDKFDGNAQVWGTLHLTITHIIFMGISCKEEMWLRNQLIASVERLPLTASGASLILRGKDFHFIRLVFARERDCQNAFVTMKRLAFCKIINDLPCFRLVPNDCYWNRWDGWTSHDIESQLRRFGLPNTAWTVTNINKNFQVCASYPTVLCVPSSVSNQILTGSARFRSRGRFPVLTYLHPNGKSALCRSSQPLAGFASRCTEDQQLLDAIRYTNPNSPLLYVVDTRPAISALTNKAQGKGYEDATVYRNISIHFFDIENIHVVRGSLDKLLKVSQDSTLTPEAFVLGLEKSGWLRHLRSILEAAFFVASRLDEGSSVLVHCSDGWDRTSQVCSLAQIIIDPYYRTNPGLQALIKKDWLLFGHKFSERCQLLSTGESREVSPIFTQFLDCIRHLIEYFPEKFEYNSHMLRTLHDEAYAASYGTFVGCSELERQTLRLVGNSYSLWPLFDRNTCNQFVNPFYERSSQLGTEPAGRHRPLASATNLNEAFDQVAHGVELTNTDIGSSREAPDVLPVFVLLPQLFHLWRGLFLRWEWRLPRADAYRTECLTDVLRRKATISAHRSLLLLRIGQLCRVLGRPLLSVLPLAERRQIERMLLPPPVPLSSSLERNAAGQQSTLFDDVKPAIDKQLESLNGFEVVSPSPLLSPIILPSTDHTTDPELYNRDEEHLVRLLSRHLLAEVPESRRPAPPSDAQLTTELASVSVRRMSVGHRREVACCPVCRILLALAAPVSHCQVCGSNVCYNCTSKKPRHLPGVLPPSLLALASASSSFSDSNISVCLSCSGKPSISGGQPCAPSYRPAVANARAVDGPILDPLVSVASQG